MFRFYRNSEKMSPLMHSMRIKSFHLLSEEYKIIIFSMEKFSFKNIFNIYLDKL
jgi:hypothetical protein